MLRPLSSLIRTVGFACILVATLHGQEPTQSPRLINIVPLNLYAPIAIQAVGLDSQSYPVPRGSHQTVRVASGSGDWLDKVQLTILNQSPKDIAAIELRLSVDDWEDDRQRPTRSVYFHEGQFPPRALPTTKNDGVVTGHVDEQSARALDVKSDSSVQISLRVGLTKLEPPPGKSMSVISGITIQIERIIFTDGTIWAYNAYSAPDPSSSEGYVKLTKDAWMSYH